MTASATPDFLTLGQVAARMALRPDTLRRKRAELEADQDFPRPVSWCARPLRWDASALDAWLNRQSNPALPPPPAAVAFRPYLVAKAARA